MYSIIAPLGILSTFNEVIGENPDKPLDNMIKKKQYPLQDFRQAAPFLIEMEIIIPRGFGA